MVRKLGIILALPLFFATALVEAQSIDLLVGGRYNINQLSGNYQYSIVVPDVDGWPLRSNFTKFSMQPSQEAQFGVRFNFKNSWYVEANYSNNVSRINLEGQSNYTDSMLNALAYNDVYNTWFNSAQNDDWEGYYNQYFDIAKNEQRETWLSDYTYTEEIKNHNTSLLFGYKFLKNRPVRPFFEIGATWMYQYRQYLYQYINQTSEYVPNNLLYYEKTPRVWYNLWFGTVGAGLQIHRIKAGVRLRSLMVDLEQPTEDALDPANYQPLYYTWNQYGFYVHYDLFSADIVKAQNKKRLKELEHVVAGDYEKKEKKFVLGARLNYPITSNVERGTYRADSMTIYNQLEFEKLDYDTVVTSYSYFDMRLGRIRRVQQSPEINIYGQFNLWKLFYFETNLGYQRTNVEIETYEYAIKDFDNSFDADIQDKGGFRVGYDIFSWRNNLKIRPYQNEIMKVFIVGGFGIDSWTPSSFQKDIPGVNNSVSHESFYNVYLLGEEDATVDAYYEGSTKANETIDLKGDSWGGDKSFITYNIGAELEFDRFKLGANFESSRSLIDPYLMTHYNRFVLSLGYNIRR